MRRGNLIGKWKGDRRIYLALHKWLRKHLPKPNQCQECGEVKRQLDLACVTGNYTEDFENWKYLCHKCHMKLDLKVDYTNACCERCKSKETKILKKFGIPHWYVSETGGWLCRTCHLKEYYLKNKIKILKQQKEYRKGKEYS